VFLQILGGSARLAGGKNPVAYIMVMTRNMAFDHVKKRGLVLEETHESGFFPAPYNVLPDALSVLPQNQRETVYLYLICGFSQREVAGIMRVPLVTVKWRFRKAKQKLQEYFNSCIS
jgi:DNA-directed RNA polymerase specialized sigma24 family protein